MTRRDLKGQLRSFTQEGTEALIFPVNIFLALPRAPPGLGRRRTSHHSPHAGHSGVAGARGGGEGKEELRLTQTGDRGQRFTPPGSFRGCSWSTRGVPGPAPALGTHITESRFLSSPRWQSGGIGRQMTSD